MPLKAKLRLSCNDPEHIDFQTIVQDVFLGNIPYMTPKGTFLINGAERVVVSQLHRSPGVFFGQSVHPNGTRIYSARVIPFKGAWMEFATDINNVMYAYIDRKKKFPVTTLLRAIGWDTDKEILTLFELSDEIPAKQADLKKAIGRKRPHGNDTFLFNNQLRFAFFICRNTGQRGVISITNVLGNGICYETVEIRCINHYSLSILN